MTAAIIGLLTGIAIVSALGIWSGRKLHSRSNEGTKQDQILRKRVFFESTRTTKTPLGFLEEYERDVISTAKSLHR